MTKYTIAYETNASSGVCVCVGVYKTLDGKNGKLILKQINHIDPLNLYYKNIYRVCI